MAATPNAALVKYGAALSFVQTFLGYIINEVESFPLAAASSPTSPFLASNADRVGLLIANTGLQNVFIGLSPSVGATNGFLLVPNGGAIAFDVRTDFTLVTRAWWDFATPSPSQLYVLELIGVRSLPASSGVGTG